MNCLKCFRTEKNEDEIETYFDKILSINVNVSNNFHHFISKEDFYIDKMKILICMPKSQYNQIKNSILKMTSKFLKRNKSEKFLNSLIQGAYTIQMFNNKITEFRPNLVLIDENFIDVLKELKIASNNIIVLINPNNVELMEKLNEEYQIKNYLLKPLKLF